MEHFNGEIKANVQELIQTNPSHFYSLCFVCIIVTEILNLTTYLLEAESSKMQFLLTKGVEMLDFLLPIFITEQETNKIRAPV